MLAPLAFGCSPPQSDTDEIAPFPEAAPGTTAATGYTLETPIQVIAADPNGAAVLNKDIQAAG